MSQTPGSGEPFEVPPLSNLAAWLRYFRTRPLPTREELAARLDEEIRQLLDGNAEEL